MQPCSIVVVASSARDLEPVDELLAALPAEAPLAFIIVQHLEPGRRYVALDDVLAKRVSQPVVVAHNGVMPAPGHVHVMRANVELTIVDGLLSVTPGTNGVRYPGDVLFTSVAADCGDLAMGVVLSGGGSDGALGVRAINEAGGATFAQYPGSARFPSMPISAIETGCIGRVLRPNEIALELAGLSRRITPRLGGHPSPASALRVSAIAG